MKRIFLIAVCLVIAAGAAGKVKLPHLMSDGMVLQQQTRAGIWGEAAAGKTVEVTTSWNGKTYKTAADRQGGWIVKVETPAWGGPYTVEISDGEKTTISDVMIGEVWVCSGQSNMQYRVQGGVNQPHYQATEAILGAGKYPQVRGFWVPGGTALVPLKDTQEASWQVSGISTVPMWSAVAYSFARHLTDALGGIPVGIIMSSYGGSGITCWMDMETIKTLPPYPLKEVTTDTKRPQDIPTLFYNAMLAPLFHYTAKGFLWYQGETNKDQYKLYPQYQAAMVELWRKQWGDPAMPFLFAQIAPYGGSYASVIAVPLFVEAQVKSVGLIPHSGIVGTNDLGEENCIHPGNKEPVGQRFAILALNNTYGVKCLTPTGPIFKEAKFEKGSALVTFDHAGLGLGRLKTPIRGFEIAGADRKFHPAVGTVNGTSTQIVVSAPEVPDPVAVRYAFKNWPAGADMVNSFGLPAFPFRTDDWDDNPGSL